MPITYYSSKKILEILVGHSTSTSFASSIYVGLSSTSPSRAGTGVTEPSGNGYARILLGNTNQSLTQKMATPSSGVTTNEEVINFPEATGSWGTLTHFCIFDSASSGNLLAFGELTTSITPTASTIPTVRVGQLSVSLL